MPKDGPALRGELFKMQRRRHSDVIADGEICFCRRDARLSYAPDISTAVRADNRFGMAKVMKVMLGLKAVVFYLCEIFLSLSNKAVDSLLLLGAERFAGNVINGLYLRRD